MNIFLEKTASIFNRFSFRHDFPKIFLLALVYFLAHGISFFFPDSRKIIMLVWPAGGIGLAAFLLNRRRLWPFLTLAFYIAGITASVFLTDRTFLSGFGYMTANMVESIGIAWLILYFSKDFQKFKRIGEVVTLIAGAIFINALSSCIGAYTSVLISGASFASSWQSWYISDGLGILLVGAFSVSWSYKLKDYFLGLHLKNIIEGATFAFVLLILSYIIFYLESEKSILNGFHPYMLVVILIWPALRLGIKGVTLALMILFIVILFSPAIINGPSPWGGSNNSLSERLLDLQLFIAFLAMVGYIMSVVYASFIDSKAKHSSMISNISDVIGIIGADGLMKYKSSNIEKWFGWQPQDLVGTDGWSNVHPDDLERIQKEFFRLIEKDNSSITLEYRYKCKDGSFKPIELTATNLVNDPIIGGFLLNYHDISERKQADATQQELFDRLQKIASLVPGVVYQYQLRPDGTSCFPYSSEGINEIYRVTPEEAREDASKVFANLHPDDYDGVAASIQASAKELSPWKYEYRVKFDDGTVRWLSGNASPQRETDGTILWHGFITDITERKQSDETLRISEEKFRSYVDYAPQGVFVTDKNGAYLEVNSAACEITGYDSDELLSMNLIELIAPESLEVAGDHFKKVVNEGFASGENFFIKKDGSINFWTVDAVRLSDNRFLGFVVDITERKLAEEKLLLYKAIVDKSNDGIAIIDKQGYYLEQNAAHYNLIGYSDEELEGETPSIHFGAEVFSSIAKVLGEKGFFHGELISHTKFGDRDVDISAFSIFNKANEVICHAAIKRDITERKKREQELKESEEKLSTLFGTMTEMVVLHELVFNEKGEAVNYRITDCNNAYTKVTGIKKENVIGKLATEVYQTEIAPYLDEFSNVAITRKPYEYISYFEPMDKHFSISVVSPQQNQFATITTDITAMQQIQKVISDKNKELENFLYVSSHDLRSPLVNVQGFSNRLQKQVDSIKTLISECALETEAEAEIKSIIEESIPKTLGFIHTNVTKMDILINALLEISRTGRVKMTIKKIDISQLIEKIVSSLNFQLTELSAKVIIQKMPACYGDENLLNQVFTNIVVNAIKYRNRAKPLVIEISSKIKHNKVIYSFKDNGMGMAQNHLEKIWNVFYRVDSASPEAGDGIGLSISKKIVDKHKGIIWAESEQGKGSVFSIELLTNEFSE